MSSLRASIASLQMYSNEEALNISDVYKFLFMEPPVSLNAMVANIASLPDSVPFHSTIVTGAALGGEVSLTLNRNGSYRFNGFMRATGAFSFEFRIVVVIQSESRQLMLAAHHGGKVFGTDTFGDRQNNWDETVTKFKNSEAIRRLWPDVSRGKMSVTRSTELSGVFGTAVDIVKDVVEFLIVAETLGGTFAVCLIIGGELGDVGVDVPGLGGMIGIGIIAGSLFIWGPLSIGPAFLIGIAAGAIVDALVGIRRITAEEEDFAREVFGDTLDFERIRITNLVGMKGAPFTTPTIDDHILVNIGVTDDMFNDPVHSVWRSYAVAGQLFIHELTHAWQILHATLDDVYIPGLVCEGIKEQVIDGKKSYQYGPPGPPWSSFSREGQAHIVDDWFAGTGRPKNNLGLSIEREDLNSPYFMYINNNILLGVD